MDISDNWILHGVAVLPSIINSSNIGCNALGLRGFGIWLIWWPKNKWGLWTVCTLRKCVHYTVETIQTQQFRPIVTNVNFTLANGIGFNLKILIVYYGHLIDLMNGFMDIFQNIYCIL